MTQNTSVLAFGDNSLARQDNPGYLEFARHLFSPGVGFLCSAYLPSTSTLIPPNQGTPQPQQNYPDWKPVGEAGVEGRGKGTQLELEG